MPDEPLEPRRRAEIEFSSLNPAGKAVYALGTAANWTAALLLAGVDELAHLVKDTREAYREGKNPPIEEAQYKDLEP